jgi:ribosomal protein S18 acetylase RimI-like enzyme
MSASTTAAAPAPFSGKATATSVPSSELFYTGIHARNIGLVRKLLEVVLPVGYSEDFYRKLQEAPGELARLAYYRDLCVGVVGCRVEDGEVPGGSGGGVAAAGSSGAARRVYMTVLAVLAPYRDRGIGSALLRGVLEALDSGKVKGAEGSLEVYLHVWQENKEAVRGAAARGRAALRSPTLTHTPNTLPPPHLPQPSDCILRESWLCGRLCQGGELLQAH